MKEVYRPSHADYTYKVKYGIRDYRGGGRSSARETISRVVAGALAKQALRQLGVRITAYTSQVGKTPFWKKIIPLVSRSFIGCIMTEGTEKFPVMLLFCTASPRHPSPAAYTRAFHRSVLQNEYQETFIAVCKMHIRKVRILFFGAISNRGLYSPVLQTALTQMVISFPAPLARLKFWFTYVSMARNCPAEPRKAPCNGIPPGPFPLRG